MFFYFPFLSCGGELFFHVYQHSYPSIVASFSMISQTLLSYPTASPSWHSSRYTQSFFSQRHRVNTNSQTSPISNHGYHPPEKCGSNTKTPLLCFGVSPAERIVEQHTKSTRLTLRRETHSDTHEKVSTFRKTSKNISKLVWSAVDGNMVRIIMAFWVASRSIARNTDVSTKLAWV